MPAILGWHPFIPSRGRGLAACSDIEVLAKQSHDIGADGLGLALISQANNPQQLFKVPLTASHSTAYENWFGMINIPLGSSHFLTLRSEDSAHVLLYIPVGLAHVSIEPITALPGALQRYSEGQKKRT
jgi:hypothetical protein